MSQNQEIIESKLCAYIDDELDETGRHEIEKHLEANPQHRRLLDELRRTSALLGSLPRETAPTELSEIFTGQLERASLLEGIDRDAASGPMRIHRWSQILTVAAILLLTVGLAAIITFALPSLMHRPQIVQVNGRGSDSINDGVPAREKDMTSPATAVASDVSSDQPESSRHVAEMEGGRNKSPLASVIAPSPAPLPEGLTDEHAALRKVAQNALSDVRVQGLVRADSERQSAAPDASSEVVMVVRSSDPTQTRQVLTDYLDANRIAWEASPVVAPADQSLAKKDAAGLNAVVMADTVRDRAADGIRGGANGAGRANAAPSAPVSPATAPTELAKGANFGAALRRSTTEPADEKLASSDADLIRSRQLSAAEARRPVAGEAEASELQGDLYFACRMSRQQAEALGMALKRDASSGPVELTGLSSWRAERKSKMDLQAVADKAPGRPAEPSGLAVESGAASTARGVTSDTRPSTTQPSTSQPSTYQPSTVPPEFAVAPPVVAGPTTGPATLPSAALDEKSKQYHFQRVAKAAGSSAVASTPTPIAPAAAAPGSVGGDRYAAVKREAGALPSTPPATRPSEQVVAGKPTTEPALAHEPLGLKESVTTAPSADEAPAAADLTLAQNAQADAVNVVIVLRSVSPSAAAEPANLSLRTPTTAPAAAPAAAKSPSTAPSDSSPAPR